MEELYIKIQNSQSIPPNSLPQMQFSLQWSYEEWPTFRSIHGVIHQNQSISKAGKPRPILETQLRGDPQNLIKHLQIIESNYEKAWSLLKDRYENNRLIIANPGISHKVKHLRRSK
ncbi:hypothetical protein JTB14_031127 [Gonioctena quinquepunctata]|nr:hypothetical protein JTB14_031127 [Gonioctena quinquepunctata]